LLAAGLDCGQHSGREECEEAVRRGVGAAGEWEVDARAALAGELRLPLVAKDTIKDALMSVLPVPDVDTSRQLGRAAVVAMLAIAAESPSGAVIESNFYRSRAVGELGRLPGQVVEVFCRVDRDVARLRYQTRADLATRGTSTRSAPPRSSGTTRSLSRWPVGGRSSRSTPPNPPTSPRSSAGYAT
jgi:hypothetical protein